MKIELTNFSKRHFDKNFKGTKILDTNPDQFIEKINIIANGFKEQPLILDGYADFCKLLVVGNWTDARTGSLPITLETLPYLKSGYFSRTEEELPVLSRWLEIPERFVPKANYLVIVLYTRNQLEQEYLSRGSDELFELDIDTDYGVVAILGQMGSNEEPMTPITMMRNALGKEEGGSGVPLNKEEYKKSVEFWDSHGIIK